MTALRSHDLKTAVSRLLRRRVVEAVDLTVEDVRGSTGKATARVQRMKGTALLADGDARPWRLTLKALREPEAGDADADRPDHWTFWRREALAYGSSFLPNGTDGLDSAEGLGVFADGDHPDGLVVAMETIDGGHIASMDDFVHAAQLLGRWQASWVGRTPSLDWLAQDQLSQRIARTDASGGLSWPDSVGDERGDLDDVWSRRWSLLERASWTAPTLTHGDFSSGNLVRRASGRLVVIDWACLGVSPTGFDLAHLVLSALDTTGASASLTEVQEVLLDTYLASFPVELHAGVSVAAAVTLALTATSRLCWALNRNPEGDVAGLCARTVPWIKANVASALNSGPG